MAAPAVLAEILRLPVEERARLALEIIRSIDGDPDPDAAEAWEAELDARAAEVAAGTADTLTLEEYRSHVRARRVARARR
jgi:putative addiction module component (TIGR02574 family)